MTREDFLKAKIKERGLNAKEFAASIGMPYTTLLSILNGSIGGAAVDNALKICNGLGITINDLQQMSTPTRKVVFTAEEESLVLAYRALPEMRQAVKILLGLGNNNANAVNIKFAARNGGGIREEPLSDSERNLIETGEEWHGDDDL